jgi:predicted  nucleic acid-binding Zn-ribbon protein
MTFGMGGRRYLTREEKIEWLEDYMARLEKELEDCRERIKDLKKQQTEADSS